MLTNSTLLPPSGIRLSGGASFILLESRSRCRADIIIPLWNTTFPDSKICHAHASANSASWQLSTYYRSYIVVFLGVTKLSAVSTLPISFLSAKIMHFYLPPKYLTENLYVLIIFALLSFFKKFNF